MLRFYLSVAYLTPQVKFPSEYHVFILVCEKNILNRVNGSQLARMEDRLYEKLVEQSIGRRGWSMSFQIIKKNNCNLYKYVKFGATCVKFGATL